MRSRFTASTKLVMPRHMESGAAATAGVIARAGSMARPPARYAAATKR